MLFALKFNIKFFKIHFNRVHTHSFDCECIYAIFSLSRAYLLSRANIILFFLYAAMKCNLISSLCLLIVCYSNGKEEKIEKKAANNRQRKNAFFKVGGHSS